MAQEIIQMLLLIYWIVSEVFTCQISGVLVSYHILLSTLIRDVLSSDRIVKLAGYIIQCFLTNCTLSDRHDDRRGHGAINIT